MSRVIERGFSLLELVIAIALTLGTGAVAFQLFHQNERVFRDQIFIVEMQQAARMLATQIADDVRLAGQGVPPGVGDFVLPGSGPARINLRQNFSAIETQITTPVPFIVTQDMPVTLGVEKTSGFAAGRQIYVWNSSQWLRATVLSVSGPGKSIQLLPQVTPSKTVVFGTPPSAALDEAVALFHEPGSQSVRRATSTNTADPEHPQWSPANEVATNVTWLSFLYFDEEGTPVDLEDPGDGDRVALVEARIRVQTAEQLSDKTRPSFALLVRASPRNGHLR
jgi:prepilin-type N-terminal cleavage/methylation domain-containing protein